MYDPSSIPQHNTHLYFSLSFYKEQLAGETKNYVHMRASADQITPVNVLRKLCEEVLECDRIALALAGSDKELANMWSRYVQVRARPLL